MDSAGVTLIQKESNFLLNFPALLAANLKNVYIADTMINKHQVAVGPKIQV